MSWVCWRLVMITKPCSRVTRGWSVKTFSPVWFTPVASWATNESNLSWYREMDEAASGCLFLGRYSSGCLQRTIVTVEPRRLRIHEVLCVPLVPSPSARPSPASRGGSRVAPRTERTKRPLPGASVWRAHGPMAWQDSRHLRSIRGRTRLPHAGRGRTGRWPPAYAFLERAALLELGNWAWRLFQINDQACCVVRCDSIRRRAYPHCRCRLQRKIQRLST